MKLNLLCVTIMMFSPLSLFGQISHRHDSADTQKHRDLTELIGTASVDTMVEGLHLRFWMITQLQHKSLMKNKKMQKMMEMEMFDPEKKIDPAKVNMKMGKETTRLMMAGTHFIIAAIADSATGNEIVDPKAALSIVSPSRRRSAVELIRTMSYFALGLTMKEKGIHHLTIDVNANGFSRIVHFRYTVR
jgi:hypothetical protein